MRLPKIVGELNLKIIKHSLASVLPPSTEARGVIGTGDTDSGIVATMYYYNPTTNTWTQAANFGGGNRANIHQCAVFLNNLLYTGLGWSAGATYNDWWKYNGLTNTWTQLANFGGAARGEAVAFQLGGKIYVGTGSALAGVRYNDFWEYNPDTNTWTQKANFPGTERHWALGFASESRGYIGLGGNQMYDITYYNDLWEYNPDTNTWTQKANPPTGAQNRIQMSRFVINNKAYMGLGHAPEKQDFWEYNPDTDTWTQKANFGGGVRRLAAGFSIGSKGYFGTGWNGAARRNDFWEYDPDTNAWTQKADFPDNRNAAFGSNIAIYG